MIYDAFAHLPIYGLDDLGLMPRGEAGAFIAETVLIGQKRKNSRFYGNNREPGYGGSFETMIVPEAANMPPTP